MLQQMDEMLTAGLLPPRFFLFQVDLLLGTWAEQHVHSLTVEEMDRYEDILNLETVDIFNFIAGNVDPPAFVDTPMMKRLQVRYKSVLPPFVCDA